MRLTKEEKMAVADLEALARRWPKTLGIFSDGTLIVMKLDERGLFPMKPNRASDRLERMDPTKIVAHIHGIKTDGGDPW